MEAVGNIENGISEFEKVMMSMIRANRAYEFKSIGLIFGLDPRRVGEYVQEYLPRLNEFGLDLSILDLDLTHDYLSLEDAVAQGAPHSKLQQESEPDASVEKENQQPSESNQTSRAVGCASSSKCKRPGVPVEPIPCVDCWRNMHRLCGREVQRQYENRNLDLSLQFVCLQCAEKDKWKGKLI